jgi:conjugal transfer mating pair stabilization protein TraN
MSKKIFVYLIAIFILLSSVKANAQYLCGNTGYIYRNGSFCGANCDSSCEALSPATTTAPTCPAGYNGFVFDPTTNQTYAVSTNTQFWSYFDSSANSFSLAVVPDSAVNSLLQSIISYNGISSAWIGLYNPQMSTDYNTVNPDRPYSWVNGSTLSYTNWASGEPNNALSSQSMGVVPQDDYGQHWIEMESNGQWNDTGYSASNPVSQNYQPYLPALIEFNNQLACVSGTEPSTSLNNTQEQNLANQYCSGNTSNCYLCTNGTSLTQCVSENTYPSGSSELCPYGQTQCNKNEINGTPQCPSGYTLQNGECVNNIAPSCPGGYTFSNGECIEKTSPSCPSGYTEVNGQCQQGNVGGSVWNTSGNELLYTSGNCIIGDSFWVGSICYNSSNNSFSGAVAYDSGWLYANMWSGSGNGIVGDGGYWQESGYIGYNPSNNSFSGQIYSPYGPEYITGSGNCLDFSGSGISGSNQVCMSLNTTAMVCPSGYTLQNGECLGTASPYCSQAGYSLTNADNTCTSTITPTYTCPSGYTLSGDQCISYSCPFGGNDQCVSSTGSAPYYCSPYSCTNYNSAPAYNVNNPPINSNNPTNNGPTNSAGECTGQVYIFSGQALQCRDPGIQTGWGGGCCTADKRWFGLANCNSQEKLLAQQRSEGECTMAGTYCAQSFLGFCLQTDQTWCCFGSMLANIIQQQTRANQGLPFSGWGSATSPDCIGFTPQQFQSINFSNINLSAFYSSIEIPAASSVQNSAVNAINKFKSAMP